MNVLWNICPFPFQKTVKREVYNQYYHMVMNDISEEFVENDIVYFLRDTSETVSEPNDLIEANDVLPEVLEYGILNGHTLVMLKQILALKQVLFFQIFLPAMCHNQYDADDRGPYTERSLGEGLQFVGNRMIKTAILGSYQNLRNEFLMNMQKFLNHVQRTIQQIEGKFHIRVLQRFLHSKYEADIKYEAESIVEHIIEANNIFIQQGKLS
ncbi:hypothetical protein JD844_014880 [Phrynosoma platyrhinos]|uniref:Uncharacterized protein n=1 Tax=Phrynosoma platyrhinos TaxID=52577 RepID=A0ABQ7T6M4_PHRPL|nr:hypothetical protein JD844_014880 [Phrynosoma platyrhinos]